MAGFRFQTPGRVDGHLSTRVHNAWSTWHAERAAENLNDIVALAGGLAADESIPYVNPATSAVPARRTIVSVPWDGFPASVTAEFGDGEDALRATEDRSCNDLFEPEPGQRMVITNRKGDVVEGSVRARQDEYLEWHATSAHGKLTSVTFVAEAYDYWQFLFRENEDYVVERYNTWARPADRDLTPDDLRAKEDLFFALEENGERRLLRHAVQRGELNYRNQFNQRHGIVHLSHRANSLSAEVALAITSALPRLDASGTLVDGSDPKRLMCCTSGGEPNRSSDPNIAAGAYRAVTAIEPKQFTLTDPIGLYIRDWKDRSLQDPSGVPVLRDSFWKVLRGDDATNPSRVDSRVLRLRVGVPDGEDFVLGDMLIDGTPLKHPAQLAQLVGMHLLVDVWPATAPAPTIACSGGCCRKADGSLAPFTPNDDGLPFGCDNDAFPGLVETTRRPGSPLEALALRRTR